MSESNIMSKDTHPFFRWDGDYPFNVVQAGRNIYQGKAQQGDGSWESATGPAGSIGYITLTGVAQTLSWNVRGQHRPVRLLLYHTDAAGAASAANYNIEYEYKDKALDYWTNVGTAVSSAPTFELPLGERYERQGGQYRLILQGPVGHFIRVTPYNQLLQEMEGRSRQGGGWPRP